ncbi:hypothetical protein, partial [Acinetobacter nosocomialis]|uniref:hypothetical protein n=1 Tax=Acinetobacter nosocomialis TaxID=106654 RepID=UPI0013D5273E
VATHSIANRLHIHWEHHELTGHTDKAVRRMDAGPPHRILGWLGFPLAGCRAERRVLPTACDP